MTLKKKIAYPALARAEKTFLIFLEFDLYEITMTLKICKIMKLTIIALVSGPFGE